jgi:UDP-N-acetylmuramate--alanine ligase
VTPGRVHIVGVGGPGTSAIATILCEMGKTVSGSDVRESPTLERLRALGVRINVTHDPGAVIGCDVVTHSSAVRSDNVELRAARMRGITVWSRGEMLGWIARQARTVGVAGTHGKTTTTTLLALMLRAAGRDPGYLVGADVEQLEHSAHWGTGEFVVEADESDSSHRDISPWATVLTNVDIDHLDEHGSFEGIVASFDDYLAAVVGPKVVGGDDSTAHQLALKHDAITFGLSGHCDVRAEHVQFVDGGAKFDVVLRDDRTPVVLPLRGAHNVRNFLGALAMADALGVNAATAVDAVRDFRGVQRRFQLRAEHDGATFVDDYAHLPAEIAAVLGGVRGGNEGWSRVIAVFQPNRFNRMSVMSDAYADAFVDADVVVVTDIYASGTDPIPGVTGELVVRAIRAAHPTLPVQWCATRPELVDYVARAVRRGDLCISMGCGDIETLPDEVVARRRELLREH